MHRFTWDLSAFGPVSITSGRGSGAGIPVAPGKYNISFEADGQLIENSLNVVPFPLLTDDGITQSDLAEQYALADQIG